ncbi:MAG: lytic transglycosylase domain-containing protein [Flavisolibacter sp.]
MNKLLLLATSCLICITLQSRGAIHYLLSDERTAVANHNDSTIKEQGLSNPKDAFKNLFETETSEGINITKLNPKAISFVQDYVEDNGARLTRMKSWGKPYFDLIGDVFTQYGLPVELKYLSVIESDLKSSAVSWAGAVGPWQFMPQTARDYGLTVTKRTDERRDYKKSTKAAARYLNDLYDIYNDWLLVVAAYNCGAGNVNSAIRKSGSHNFWDLQYYLPAESRNHVKKFIATHYIMEGDGGLTTLTKKEREGLATAALVTDPSVSTASISGKYTSMAIASIIQMNITDFNALNPNFDKSIASNGSYDLHLPAEKMNSFQTNKSQILEQSIRMMLSAAR